MALVPVFLLLFVSPLPRAIRLMLPFSYYFLFEYSVVARHYVLSAALLFALAALDGQRLQRPIRYGIVLALLAWTNVHSLVAAGVLTGWFVYDLYRERAGGWKPVLAVAIAGAAILAVPVLLTPDPTQGLQYYYGWRWLLFSGAAAIWPGIQRETFGRLWPLALAWIPLAWALTRGRRPRSVLVASWAWLGFLFMFKHSGALNHYGLIFAFFLFAWWLDEEDERRPAPARSTRWRRVAVGLFALVVLAQAAYAVVFYAGHRGRHFSGAAEMAEFIRAAGLEGRELVAYPAYIGTALLPYLPDQKIHQMEDGRTTTYMTWTLDYFRGLNTPFPALYDQTIRRFAARPAAPKEILLLCSDSALARPEWELLFRNTRPSVKEDEFFRLYRVALMP